MSNIVKTGLYDEDLHGNSPDNKVVNEIHTLQVPEVDDYHFIIPRAAPFFVATLKVINPQTNQPYVANIDYTIGHHFIEAMDSIGRPIAGSIRFMRRDIVGQVKLEYQTLGGNWGFNDQLILAELARRQYNPIVRVWGNIGALPHSFPPLVHDQSLDTLVGSEDLNDSLIRIADILEATAAGTTDAHLSDFNNPHKVTKVQTGLGDVDNYKTATNAQTVAGTATNLFTTPRGVFESIKINAIDPLSTHIQETGNVHGLTKADIGLGNVENYPPANNQQALDINNNNTVMTPYATFLMLQEYQGGSELEALQIAFARHLAANNPHDITPAKIGTLTETQIINLISDAAGGSIDEFGGMSPDDWKYLFPHDEDFIGLMEHLTEKEDLIFDEVQQIPTIPDISSSDNDLNNIGTFYDGYSVSNQHNEILLVTRYGILGLEKNIKYGTIAPDAFYYVDETTGDLVTGGASPITVNSNVGVPDDLAAGKNGIVTHDRETGKVVYTPRSGAQVVLWPADHSDEILELDINSGMNTNKTYGVVTYRLNGTGNILHKPFGDAGWVTAYNNLISSLAPNEVSTLIYSDYIGISYNPTTTTETLKFYRINHSGTTSLTDVTAAVRIYNVNNDNIETVNQFCNDNIGLNPVGVHTTVTVESLKGVGYIDFGNLNNPQWPLRTNNYTEYPTIIAGNDFILTMDKYNNVDFWGDSLDGTLYFPGIKRL